MKHYPRVVEKVGRLRQQYRNVSCQYDIEVKPDAKGHHVIAVEWRRNGKHERNAGASLLRTSLTQVGQRADRSFVLDLERSGSDVPESEIGVGAASDLSLYPQVGSGAFADIGTGLSGSPYAADDVASSGRNDELEDDPSHAGEHSSDHDGDGRVEWTSSAGTSEYAAEC